MSVHRAASPSRESLGSDQATSEEVDVPNGGVPTRGDRRRNEKLTRLRLIGRRDIAILGSIWPRPSRRRYSLTTTR